MSTQQAEEVVEEVRDPAGVLKENQRLQSERKELEKQIASLETRLADAGKELASASDSKYKLLALQKEATSALKEQGVKDVERVLEILDLDGVDFDDENQVTGLTEKVDGFKAKFPEFFKKGRAATASADIHASNPPEKKQTGTERQIAHLFR